MPFCPCDCRRVGLGYLSAAARYTTHDRDSKYCDAFSQILDDAGVKRLPLPPRSPWLNAYAERWVKSVKDEALSRVILFGESSLRHVLSEYVEHYHGYPLKAGHPTLSTT
jgi:transposase InsO family protein